MTTNSTPQTKPRILACAIIRASLISLMLGTSARCEDDVVIRPTSTEAQYCISRGGHLTMHLLVDLEYENRGSEPILIPAYTNVSSYTLFRLGEASTGKVEGRKRLGKRPMDNPESEYLSRFYSVLPPAGKLNRRESVELVVGERLSAGEVSNETDHYIQLEIDHWPLDRKLGETLRKSRKDRGVLLISKVKTAPIKLHVGSMPDAVPCWNLID